MVSAASSSISAGRHRRLATFRLILVDIGRRIAFFGVLTMLVIAILTLVDILLRWWSWGSVPGLNEILALGIAVAVAATFPAGAAEGFNLAVDLIATKLPERTTLCLHAIAGTLLLAFYFVLVWCVFGTALEIQLRGAVTVFLRWPQAPFIWAVAALLIVSVTIQVVVVLGQFQNFFRSGVSDKSPLRIESRRIVSVAGWVTGVGILLLIIIFVGHEFAIVKAAQDHPIWTAIVLMVAMMVMVFLMVPIAAAMGLAGVAGALLLMGVKPAFVVLGTTAVDYLTKPEMAVLPFFLIMGAFAGVAGLSDDVYRMAQVLTGHRRGGLAFSTVAGCAGFGALSSSSIATCAAIGQIVLPEMRKRNYGLALATGVVAAGGTLAPLISPGSGPLVIYALLTEQSISQLFIGSALPAILAVILFWLTVALYIWWWPDSAPQPIEAARWPERVRVIANSWGVLVLIVLVFGGIYGGVFTVTEAAAVGACISFGFALLRGKLSNGALWRVMSEVTSTTAMLYVMFFGAVMFSYFVDFSGLPEVITTALEQLPLPSLAIIAAFLVVFVLLGCVMESFAVLLIVVPIVVPYVHDMGYSLIWWGVVMVGVVETGMITPPLGLNLLVLKNIAGNVSTGTVYRGVFPFILADLVRLVLLVLFPALVTWLPGYLK
jgi:C4-dicarboxylate transporter, DctM subunit